MNKIKTALIATGKFLKRNIYYVLIFVAIASIGTIVGVAVSKNKVENGADNSVSVVTPINNDQEVDKKIDDPIEKEIENNEDPVVVDDPIVFITPVDGAVGASYSDTELVFSKTLEQWSTHRGIDFMAEIGSDVLCVYDGVVSNIDNDPMLGYCVTISHGNGLITKYCGLSDAITVSVSQSVKKGTKIGEVGDTMIIESADGAHLHFEAYKNGQLVNPMDYFVMSEK